MIFEIDAILIFFCINHRK